jgi:hypothetical protein
MKANASFRWNVSGNVLHHYVADADNAYVVPLTPDDPGDGPEPIHTGTQVEHVEFFWVSISGEGPDSRDVALTVNLNGHSLIRKTNFSVHAPFVDILTRKGAVVADEADDGRLTFTNNSTTAFDPVNAAYGGFQMSVRIDVPAGFEPGIWQGIQLIEGRRSVAASDGSFAINEHYGERLLDGHALPAYAGGPTNHSPRDPGGDPGGAYSSWINTADSPANEHLNGGIILKGETLRIPVFHTDAADQFDTYVMFKPAGDSEWVPLKKVHWFWSGSATRTWSLDPGSDDAGIQPPVDCTSPPEWNGHSDPDEWVLPEESP